MMNHYQKLQQRIKASESLKERTREAAREMRNNKYEPRHLTQRQRPKKVMKVMAAVCVFGLFVGGVALWQQRPVQEVAEELVTGTFGIVAYAADGVEIKPINNLLTFDIAAGGSGSPEKGYFTGCLFKLTGEDIENFTVSFDNPNIGLYRQKTIVLEQDDKEILRAIIRGETPEVQGADEIMIRTAINQNEDTQGQETQGDYEEGIQPNEHWEADACWKLGNTVTEPYDPEASYGFWVAPGINEMGSDADLQAASHARIDALNNVNMKIDVTFKNGTQTQQTLHLKTGKLTVEYRDGISGPQFTGELAGENDPYIYGVYAQIENES